MNQVRIISELEKEKKKMQDDVQKLKDAKVRIHLNIAFFSCALFYPSLWKLLVFWKYSLFKCRTYFIYRSFSHFVFYFHSKAAKRWERSLGRHLTPLEGKILLQVSCNNNIITTTNSNNNSNNINYDNDNFNICTTTNNNNNKNNIIIINNNNNDDNNNSNFSTTSKNNNVIYVSLGSVDSLVYQKSISWSLDVCFYSDCNYFPVVINCA